eukprot:gnl/MRDRNA2_/MRDRNA2_70993_c0_seq1.p1 gnl/MRDRNA2_/MRDRNA2_70993_c0~~gnl/MRDRNA2_/MRDRNA2_70993_c0_seq1.p1  ORF type:complete len:225 (+),score=20.72 gnl/MRDRNA2_/MRDRNA2_70993_c0_seq1:44-676(+)
MAVNGQVRKHQVILQMGFVACPMNERISGFELSSKHGLISIRGFSSTAPIGHTFALRLVRAGLGVAVGIVLLANSSNGTRLLTYEQVPITVRCELEAFALVQSNGTRSQSLSILAAASDNRSNQSNFTEMQGVRNQTSTLRSDTQNADGHLAQANHANDGKAPPWVWFIVAVGGLLVAVALIFSIRQMQAQHTVRPKSPNMSPQISSTSF